MARENRRGGCGCLSSIITLVIILVLIGGFLLSRYTTIEQAGLSDKPGIASFISDQYEESTTFKDLQMENWTLWDLFMWMLKSGNYTPKEKSDKDSIIEKGAVKK